MSQSADVNFTPYQPRPVEFLGVRTLNGYRLKEYSILYGNGPFVRDRFEPALAIAATSLPQPAVTLARPGVGFALLHQGRTADYFVLGYWDNENELPLKVLVRGEAGWRPAAGSESVCVWDLKVIWHEREAYVTTVMSGTGNGPLDAYLSRVMSGYA